MGTQSNRDIKFRGKRVNNGEWMYGYYAVDLLENEDSGRIHYIIPFSKRLELYHPLHWVKVRPETVSQYWGKDRKDKDIYVGDEVLIFQDLTDAQRGILVFDEDEGVYRFDLGTEEFLMIRPCQCEVIGHIHKEKP